MGGKRGEKDECPLFPTAVKGSSPLDIEIRPPLEPFLKWPGGKRALIKRIIPHLPKSFNCFYEPFLGAGALFFALRPQEAVLGDLNGELVECYFQVRDFPTRVLSDLRRFKNSKEEYYRIRDWHPTSASSRAARLVYLTSLSFNGIYRLNERGQFNVPYGGRNRFNVYRPNKIVEASIALSRTKLVKGDFEGTVSSASAGDLVYMDPPYITAHSNNGFVKYNDRVFSWKDQMRLSEVTRELARRGCVVAVSNADHPSITKLYHGFRTVVIHRNSIIAASPDGRKMVTERLFLKGGATHA